MLFLQVRIHSRPKKAVPVIDTVPARKANWCCTVMNGSLLFNTRQDYETTTHNNRSRASGGVWEV